MLAHIYIEKGRPTGEALVVPQTTIRGQSCPVHGEFPIRFIFKVGYSETISDFMSKHAHHLSAKVSCLGFRNILRTDQRDSWI